MHSKFSLRSNAAYLITGTYLVIFFLFIFLSLKLPDRNFWDALFLLSYPWSMLVMYVGAWSIAHNKYPVDYYFVPGALINAICLFLLCRLSKRKPNKVLAIAFCASSLFLCCSAYPQEASAQAYELGNDEFSVLMPGKPDIDKNFSSVSPAFDAYRVTANDIQYLVFLLTKNPSARKGYEHQVLSMKGHSIGYNAGFIRESNRSGVSAEIVLDRDLKLNGFPGRQYRIISKAEPGVLRFYATDRFIYTLQVLGATEKDPPVKEFFDSFKLRRRRANAP